MQGHTDSVWHRAFSPDGKLIASAPNDGTTRIWASPQGKCLQRLMHLPEQQWASWHANGYLIDNKPASLALFTRQRYRPGHAAIAALSDRSFGYIAACLSVDNP